MRVALGFLVAGAALAAAVWLHSGLKANSTHVVRGRISQGGRVLTPLGPREYTLHSKASWQDPLAIFLAVAGAGAGIAIALPGVRSR